MALSLLVEGLVPRPTLACNLLLLARCALVLSINLGPGSFLQVCLCVFFLHCTVFLAFIADVFTARLRFCS